MDEKKIREFLPKSEKHLPINYVIDNPNLIMVGNSEYYIQRRNYDAYRLFRVIITDKDVQLVEVNNNKKYANKKLGTKKGKISMGRAAVVGLCAIVLVAGTWKLWNEKKSRSIKEPVLPISSDIPIVEPIPDVMLNSEEILPVPINEIIGNIDGYDKKDSIMANPIPSYKINKKESVMVDLTNVSYLNENPLVKRKKVLERFPYIPNYLEDVGLSPEIGICLVSQESGDESYPYKDQFQNIWQLTTSIIDEPMKVPLVNGKEGEFRKIYVYSSERENTVKTAKKLQNEGYLIFSIEEAEENPEINTLIATTYLAHCINKTGSLLGGMVGYNSGYGVVKNYSNEALLAGAVRNSDSKYLKHVVQYASENDIVIGWILWKNGEISHNLTTIHIDGLIRPLEEENEEVKHHI